MAVLLKNIKVLLEISNDYNENKLAEATKKTLKLLEQESSLRNFTILLRTEIKGLLKTDGVIKDISDLPDKPLKDLFEVILNLIKNEHDKQNSELLEFLSSRENKTTLQTLVNILIDKNPKLQYIMPRVEDMCSFLSSKEKIEQLTLLITNARDGNKMQFFTNIAKKHPPLPQEYL